MAQETSKDKELQELAEAINWEPRTNFERKFNTPYPLIDSDPHFSRVVRYFRPSDYITWGIGAAAFPGLFYFMESYETSIPKTRLKANLMFCTVLGTFGGFLFAYQNSSKRFWGWSENAREVEKDNKEMTERIQKGLAPYGESSLDTFTRQAAANNSRYSALKFAAIPWFNFVNHTHHGVDAEEKYDSKQ